MSDPAVRQENDGRLVANLMHFARTLRAAGLPVGPGKVLDAVAAVDPIVPTGSVRTMDQVLSHSLALRNFMMFLLSLFAALALTLATVGIYGVISYAVSQRTREIGVRMALGARPADILKMVFGQSLVLVAIGTVLGLLGAFALTRVLEGLLFAVGPTDASTFGLMAALLAISSLAACLGPARRAAKVDPMVALRAE